MDAEEDAAKIKAIVDRLCDEYKSHLYQIGRAEAPKIGLNVIGAPGGLETATMDLLRFYIGRPVCARNADSVRSSVPDTHRIRWTRRTSTFAWRASFLSIRKGASSLRATVVTY